MRPPKTTKKCWQTGRLDCPRPGGLYRGGSSAKEGTSRFLRATQDQKERSMTHADAHAHGHHEHDTEGPRPYFPEAEWEEFKKDDIKAGSAIILEMASIFSI